MMLTTVLVTPERAAEWEQVWESARDYARRQAGFQSMRLLRDTTQPGHYMALSEWESRSNFDSFVRTSGLNWLNRGLELWQTVPPVRYEEILAGGDSDQGT
jgi:heme-degrading monooxygenase HmoA